MIQRSQTKSGMDLFHLGKLFGHYIIIMYIYSSHDRSKYKYKSGSLFVLNKQQEILFEIK